MKTILTLLAWCAGTLLLTAQSTITGKITDVQGAAIQGAAITVKGTSTATYSDGNGSYSLKVPDLNATLVITSVGFDKQEVKVNGRTVINIQLKPSLQQLQEVVVIGYGTAKRSMLTGSVAGLLSGRASCPFLPWADRGAGLSFFQKGMVFLSFATEALFVAGLAPLPFLSCFLSFGVAAGTEVPDTAFGLLDAFLPAAFSLPESAMLSINVANSRSLR